MIATSDPLAKFTTKDEVIAWYLERLNELKQIAEEKYGIDSEEFLEMFEKEFLNEQQLCTTPNSEQSIGKHEMGQFSIHSLDVGFVKYVYSQLKRYAYCITVLAFVFILVTYHVELNQLFMRKIQVYIYPGMRLWRKLTLPIIRQFPILTELYDETCLIPNPFFRVPNLDCSPCADVINVVDLTMVPHIDYLGNNIPHIIKQNDNVNQSIAQIHQLYQQNRHMFREEAYKVYSTDGKIKNLDHLFAVMLNKNGKSVIPSHNLWRINRMTPARILRALFPAPKSIPKHAGIDIERYLAFDVNGGVTYQLPSTDCSNMFVNQVIGSRVIHLQPTGECEQHCRRISVKLKQNHTLFYDWWYWKPFSAPASQLVKTTSVSYIGSYC